VTEGLTLDAGALIAVDRNDRTVVVLLARALEHELALAIPAGVVAQAWRNGRRQVRLARLLASPEVEVEVLDDTLARGAGQLCGVTGTADIVDASVVLCARRRKHKIVTSDPDDLRRLDARVPLIAC
jgi:hypothetical protein